MSINFCHIVPVDFLHLVEEYPVHLLLAHLIEDNLEYRQFYIDLKKKRPEVFYHMDCSAFEMFKRGTAMYDSNKLIDMANLVDADSIVISDYPKEPWQKTMNSAIDLIPKIKQAGFQTFYCPQSELGDIDGLMKSFEWAIDNNDIDYIGVSILNCPIGVGVNETTFGDGARNESYRLQRFLSRWKIFEEMRDRNILKGNVYKRFHCLGMMDGPNEIDLLKPYHPYIFSWDSSSAVQHALYGIKYDKSPTGLMNGKCEVEVDFDYKAEYTVSLASAMGHNVGIIDRMCGGNNVKVS